MVKKIITTPGRTFHEFSLLPGHSKKDCVIPKINLSTNLAGLQLKIPLISSAMTSVTGYWMALALGKEGGLGILPVRLPVEEQVRIVKKIKNYEMGFVEEPTKVRETVTIEDALRQIKTHGHSKIPIVDKNNVFLGMFTQSHYWESNANSQDEVTEAMLLQDEVPCCNKANITFNEAKKLLSSMDVNYLVVLDEQDRLVKVAFRKDVEKIKIGVAISTYEGWKDRVRDVIKAGVDLITIDTSDAYNDFTKEVLKEYKKMKLKVPICAGNVVTYDGAMFLMKNGADIIKIGMSSGSICITQREKAVGRSPMTALMEAARARRDFYNKTRKYVPLILDGGVSAPADMIIALTLANAVMMGGYFNKFYESAAEKFDEKGKQTRIESEMRSVATWGEGSERAQNLARYGKSKKTFFEEGVEGTVPYVGRLKPYLKKDLMKIKAALSNVGTMNLKDFRKNAVIELISQHSSSIISKPHSMREK